MRLVSFILLVALFCPEALGRGLVEPKKRVGQRSSYPNLSLSIQYGNVQVGGLYRAATPKIHPTQFAAAREEIEHRKKQFRNMSPGELENYLRKKIGSVVIGPGGTMWLVDGHHASTALHELGIGPILVEVLEDHSKLPMNKFLEKMLEKKWMYVKDENGILRKPQDLPKSLSDLADDPYRALAWKVENVNGYADRSVPFQEFLWGDYYREHIPLEMLQKDPKGALVRAIEISRNPAAAGLPGFYPPHVACQIKWQSVAD